MLNAEEEEDRAPDTGFAGNVARTGMGLACFGVLACTCGLTYAMQEEREACHVAAQVAPVMEELLSDLEALCTLDYLFFFGPCAQVQCYALVPARCCASI